MNIWIYQYCDVLRGEYIYKALLSTETKAINEYKGTSFISLNSGVTYERGN